MIRVWGPISNETSRVVLGSQKGPMNPCSRGKPRPLRTLRHPQGAIKTPPPSDRSVDGAHICLLDFGLLRALRPPRPSRSGRPQYKPHVKSCQMSRQHGTRVYSRGCYYPHRYGRQTEKRLADKSALLQVDRIRKNPLDRGDTLEKVSSRMVSAQPEREYDRGECAWGREE